MVPIYGKEVTRLTSGGLTDVGSYNNRNTANNRCEKSAEAIVPKKKGSREGLNLNQVKVNECYPMQGRMQKISYDNSQGKDRSETESKMQEENSQSVKQ